jgi:hypothetical protein
MKISYSKKRQLLEYYQNLMAEAFYESQANCPVKTGKLKLSGFYYPTAVGATITYLAEYAPAVRYGSIGGRQNVGGYWRRGLYVKNYVRAEPPRSPNSFMDAPIQKAQMIFSQRIREML